MILGEGIIYKEQNQMPMIKFDDWGKLHVGLW